MKIKERKEKIKIEEKITKNKTPIPRMKSAKLEEN